MKLTTAVKTLHRQATWLGITPAELLADIDKFGRILYPELVVEAYNVYTINRMIEEELS
jgi:hypothetical protein